MSSDNKNSTISVFFDRDKLTASVCLLSKVELVRREDVLEELKRLGVSFGINQSNIEVFCSNPTRDPVVVAEGMPPVPGRDGYLELHYLNCKKNILEDENDIVDYRETSDLISVEKGTLLAEVHPPTPGKEGLSVTGEVIRPPRNKEIKLKAGKGVYLSEQGDKAYADVDGRPWIREVGLTRVVFCDPIYTLNGDVDIKTGNLRFKGNIKINGSVCEAMEVQADGDIEIQGLVSMARVSSGGKIVVYGNVISSSLKAGMVFPGAKKLSFMFSDINTELQNIKKAMDQLIKGGFIKVEPQDFGRIIISLMDTRFKNIRPLVKNIQSFVGNKTAGEEVPADVLSVANMLGKFLDLRPMSNIMFEDIVNRVAELCEALDKCNVNSGGNIIVRTAISSVLQSSANVIVTGQGCINSNINAGGNVTVRGVFKGGEILCDGNAEINELGSNLGVSPVVRVAAGKTIKVNKAFAGSVIQVGKKRVTITSDMDAFKARLNKEEQLEIY